MRLSLVFSWFFALYFLLVESQPQGKCCDSAEKHFDKICQFVNCDSRIGESECEKNEFDDVEGIDHQCCKWSFDDYCKCVWPVYDEEDGNSHCSRTEKWIDTPLPQHFTLDPDCQYQIIPKRMDVGDCCGNCCTEMNEPLSPISVSATADDTFTMWHAYGGNEDPMAPVVDGNSMWPMIETFSITPRCGVNVLTVRVQDIAQVAVGFIAKFQNHPELNTNSIGWRCKRCVDGNPNTDDDLCTDNWRTLAYDDSNWADAGIATFPWPGVGATLSPALWIYGEGGLVVPEAGDYSICRIHFRAHGTCRPHKVTTKRARVRKLVSSDMLAAHLSDKHCLPYFDVKVIDECKCRPEVTVTTKSPTPPPTDPPTTDIPCCPADADADECGSFSCLNYVGLANTKEGITKVHRKCEYNGGLQQCMCPQGAPIDETHGIRTNSCKCCQNAFTQMACDDSMCELRNGDLAKCQWGVDRNGMSSCKCPAIETPQDAQHYNRQCCPDVSSPNECMENRCLVNGRQGPIDAMCQWVPVIDQKGQETGRCVCPLNIFQC